MTRPTGEDAMSSEHVEVLWAMLRKCVYERLARKSADREADALAAAIAALSAPQPPAEAQGGGEVVEWDSGSPCVESRPIGMVYPVKPAPRASGYLDSSGVEWNAYDTGQMESYARAAYSDGWSAGYRAALAQQPAPVGVEALVGNWKARAETKRAESNNKDWAEWLRENHAGAASAFTTCARELSAALAPQPAAVDEAMERVRLGPARLWQADLVGGQISIDRMHEILTAALAAQQGGAK